MSTSPAIPTPPGSTTPCQQCMGSGQVGPVHIVYGTGVTEWRDNMPCGDCNGTGRWSVERLRLWRSGEAARRARIARGETLREAAKGLGVSLTALAARERGVTQ